MKSIYYIVLLAVLFLASGCGKEDDLTPSGHEKDWMVIPEPDSDDPVDKLRYDIYKKYGVLTYYTDTIGQEERVDMSGNEYIYYELLKVYYAPGNTKPTGSYVLLKDHSVLEPILDYFSKNVFNRFSDTDFLPAFLFVDEIWSSKSFNGNQLDSYFGYNTMVVRTEPDFLSLDEGQKKEYVSMFIVNYFGSLLSSTRQAVWRDEFLNLSKQQNPDNNYLYSSSTNYGTTWAEAFAGTKFTEKEELGFIISITIESKKPYEAVPTALLDVCSYVDAVLKYSVAEFEEKYGKYDVVKKKYQMMRDKLLELGFKIE